LIGCWFAKSSAYRRDYLPETDGRSAHERKRRHNPHDIIDDGERFVGFEHPAGFSRSASHSLRPPPISRAARDQK
jgi:hypothetical protein